MIHLKIGQKTVLVLEPGNIKRLKEGHALFTQDEEISICYTPDMEFLQEEIRKIVEKESKLSVEQFVAAIELSSTRTEIVDRPVHPPELLLGGERDKNKTN